jgi:Uncharacterized protein conserved in bacteria
MRDKAVVLFCKLPVAGEVKTRLASETDKEFAKKIYALILNRLIFHLDSFCHKNEIDLYFFVSQSKIDEFKIYIESIIEKFIDDRYIRLQIGEDIGIKMVNAFDFLFSAGHHDVVLIGSDIVGDMTTNVSDAFLKLCKYDYVVGPAFDGGFYLIGASNGFDRSLFDGIEWSTDKVLKKLLFNLEIKKYTFDLLNRMLDIDRFQDLKLAVESGFIESDIVEDRLKSL